MKIAYIVPGSGGSFYCGNCFRDSSYIKTIKESGHETLIIPMYLPLSKKHEEEIADTPIFYGAVNMYLKQAMPFFKRMPKWLERFFDSDFILQFAANQAGSTRASGLEEMTNSMLRGEHGNQADELEMMINWLKNHEKPDVIHLSNALLTGLAPALKRELKIPVLCTLQDEDEWLDEMQEPYLSEAWQLIEDNTKSIDAYVAVSKYYSGYFSEKLSSAKDKIVVIHNGITPKPLEQELKAPPQNTIGFMSRMNEVYGLDLLIDAFIQLKNNFGIVDLKLKLSGGYTKDDASFIKSQKKKLKKAGLIEDVEFIDEVTDESKKRFWDEISLYCVPAQRKEAFGMHLLEATAAGIPSVMPDMGAYSEILNLTKSGILCKPKQTKTLADGLYKLLSDKKKYLELQSNCFTGISQHFDSQRQLQKTLDLYSSLIQKSTTTQGLK